MPKETTNHKLRYPEKGDPDTLAAYWQHLAEDTERELNAIKQPTVDLVSATEGLILGTAYADVPGLEVKVAPSVASNLFLLVALERITGEASVTFRITVDGVAQPGINLLPMTSVGALCGSWPLKVVLAAGAHTIKVQAKRGAEGTAKLNNGTTCLQRLLLAS